MAFHGSLILRALFVLYTKKTQKRYITTLWSVPFRDNYRSLWSNLKTKIINFNQTDDITMSDFITNLDPHKKVLLLLGGLSLPFDYASVVLIKRFIAELVALWLTK